MQYTCLGRTGLKVSRLCLGTMNFGPHTTEPDSFKIMDRALELGINFFDSANIYGGDASRGATEEIVGRWLAQGGGRRDAIVLGTKVFGGMGEGPNEGRTLSAYHIRRQCDESLRRLQTDRIDLYQMHHIDRNTPWEEIWQAMEQLVRQGKIIYVGSSNFPAWSIAKGNMIAGQRDLLGLVCEQSLYNLMARTIELEVIPCCREFGVGLIPWSPLAGGLLAGAPAKPDEGRRGALGGEREKSRDRLERYEALCKKLGQRLADVALAWLLSNPAVTAPIIGPRTLAQLQESPRAVEIELSAETFEELDRIWPGPGGPAPEAYAW